MFELFNEAIAKPVQCGLELVVDETLYSCRGRFPFKQYMPQKPGKYGFLYKASKPYEFTYFRTPFLLIVTDPDPGISFGSKRIRICNTAYQCCGAGDRSRSCWSRHF